MKRVALLVLVACGGSSTKPPVTTQAQRPQIATAADRILPLLPEGAQVVIEIDLARLRANAVVGPLVTKALDGEGLPALPGAFAGIARSRSAS
ncbi:MAG TPA: hypothetical protein VM513_07425, partial [Kofleriaceae bacterium]|nr:hypothetical protein [Kofleriaceae bacterium]